MPIQKLVQNNFTSGQYDRTVQGKEQSVLVANGLAKAMNVLSSDAGEIRKRLGTKNLMEIGESAVIVPFRLPDGDDVLLLFTDQYVKAYQFKGDSLEEYLVPDNNAPTFPVTGWTGKTNGNYTVDLSSDSADTGWGYGFNACGFPYYGNGSLWTITQTVLNIPAYIGIESTSAQILDSLYIRWVNTCNGNHTGHYKGWYNPVLQYSDDGVEWISVETDSTNPYSGDSKIYQASHHYGSGSGEKTENYTLYKVINVNHNTPHKYWRVWCMDRIRNTQTYSGERLEVFVSNVKYVSDTQVAFEQSTSITSDLLKNIKYSQQDTEMIVVAKDVKPLQFDYSANGLTLTTFTAIDSFGKPASVSFFQNRLWFGGIAGFPTTVIGSKFGDYDVYTASSPVAYDDYLNLTCNELKSRITNIMGSQNVLYCFSEDGISFVDGGSTGILATNQNVEFHLKNRMPSGEATPTFKDDVLLYGSSDGTKLYAIDYDLLVSRCQVDDLAKYAKDVVFDKITELHYINNESKLVYGLMENNQMFSLLYKKGEYQGFFPMSIQDGFIFDICPVKRGRDYFLVLVTCRSGRWYIEEKLDKGVYENTDDPLMTAEDKKWATYDNLEYNVALDCYKRFDRSFSASVEIETALDSVIAKTTANLTPYIGTSVMFGLLNNDTKWHIATIDSEYCETKNCSKFVNTNDSSKVRYYIGNTQTFIGHKAIYDADGKYAGTGTYNSITHKLTEDGTGEEYTFIGGESVDILYGYYITTDVVRGTETIFDTVLPEFDRFPIALPSGTEVGVISEGRYMGEFSGDSISVYDSLFAWKTGGDIVYTKSDTPAQNDQLYDTDGNEITSYYQNIVAEYDSANNQIVVNAQLQQTTSDDLYGWGNDVYTLSATPVAGDLLYNADGTPATAYYDNKVDSYANGEITVIDSYTPYPAQYAWSSENDTIYAKTSNTTIGDTLVLTDETALTIQGKADSVTHYGVDYARNPATDGTYTVLSHGSSNSYYMLGYGTYLVRQDIIESSATTSAIYKVKTGTTVERQQGSCTINRTPYIVYDGDTYTRDIPSDIPAGQTKNVFTFARNSDIDVAGVTISTIVTKTFARDTSIDQLKSGVFVDLPFPVHKIIYGATYESYAIIKVQRPYESLKTVQQINISVIDTAHLKVGTGYNDLQELEKIKDDSHYDLTAITMNGVYKIVPSDTPEWDKYIIMKSDKGLPFTVVSVEAIMNYSNEGGN